MPLFADSIGFGEPPRDFVIYLLDACESKGVEMISGRKGFDPAKPRAFQTARQNDVAINPVLSNDEGGEAHANLKGDSRLFREHD